MSPTDEDFWERNISVHNWPECGPDSLSIEALYQAFKVRYEIERQAESPPNTGERP